MNGSDDSERDWSYAKRDCPKCGSDNTWTNTDDFRCDDCGFSATNKSDDRSTGTDSDDPESGEPQ